MAEKIDKKWLDDPFQGPSHEIFLQVSTEAALEEYRKKQEVTNTSYDKAEKDHFSFIKNDFWPIFIVIIMVVVALLLNKKNINRSKTQAELTKPSRPFFPLLTKFFKK